jgi:hypothetical protein
MVSNALNLQRFCSARIRLKPGRNPADEPTLIDRVDISAIRANAGADDIQATLRTYYRSGMKLPLTLHPLPLFFRGRFGFVISGSAPDSSKLHEYKYPKAA